MRRALLRRLKQLEARVANNRSPREPVWRCWVLPNDPDEAEIERPAFTEDGEEIRWYYLTEDEANI